MEGRIALEEHLSTALDNSRWDSKGEETRNGRDYTQDIDWRLLDSDLCLREMDPWERRRGKTSLGRLMSPRSVPVAFSRLHLSSKGDEMNVLSSDDRR